MDRRTTHEPIQCKTCLKHVPKSAAMSFEGEDYIWHFCGKNCYAKWQERTDQWLSEEKDRKRD